MATEFSPNLDDGELWLPSDIIPEVGSRRPIPSGSDIEALAKQLAAFRFLDPYGYPNGPLPAVNPPPELAEGFGPVTGFRFGYDGCRILAETGAYLQGYKEVQQFKTSKPVQAQVADGFGQGRGGVAFQWQQHKAARAQFHPFRVNGSGRACAGTGVFLPRVINNEVERKHTSMEVGEPKKQPVRSRVGGKEMQVMPLNQPPAEISLPQEWTY